MSELRISGLTVTLRSDGETTPILRGVDLEVRAGAVQGLAGESGSGKTITGLAVMGLEPATAEVGGEVWLDDTPLLALPAKERNRVRGRRIAMVFQDPSTSLHPQVTIGVQLVDHVRHHLRVDKAEARDRALVALDRVGIGGGAATLLRYPHEFSGGQRQRIAIAVALACEPEVLIADEPTTALDVTVQAGVLALMRGLVDSLGLAVLFITHDLGVMSAIADTVAVMRHGEVVENGPRSEVFANPRHPYTRSLLTSLPGAGLRSRDDLARLAAVAPGADVAGGEPS